MSKKVRIKDIAERLGLSSTLVSLVLNNKANQQGIKTQTQEKVIAMAHSMGYFEAGDSLYKPDSHVLSPGIVGMIVSSLKDPFIIEMSEHLRRAFASIGFGFSILTLDNDDARYSKIVSSIKRMFSAVVLTGDSADEEIVRSLKASSFPFLILEKADVNLRSNEVVSDYRAGAIKLIMHLSDLGYKKYTVIRTSSKSLYLDDKLKAVKAGLIEYVDESSYNECRLEVDITNSINDDDLIPFLNSPLRTEVFIVSEAVLVYPVLQCLEQLKVRIPGDIALVSLEGGPAFNLLSTPLTYLNRDIPSMASKVVSMLWSEIKNRGKSKYKRTASLTPDLVIGRSCGKL